ncbi:phosphate ABC transporter substrate-binding protein, PhoT family (TC 3.A.1.7.1) [Lachnospiraceae bacterium C7]|nr:phosphate ABC transporter substrate-binding protein, PhoT family (TC 3.A.1.7.1) [Lachnospiraceae bacterium C7]
MKNTKVRNFIVLTAAASMMVVSATGCSTTTETKGNETNQESNQEGSNKGKYSPEEIKGKVAMAGSTSMEKLATAFQETFMEEYPNTNVTAEFTGSSAGIESLQAGTVQIGNASRALSDDEKASGIEENVVAIDGIAVVVDPENDVEDIKSEDLKKIYTGEITNWKELGGKDQSIVVVGREAGSGTRDAFEELLDLKDKCKYANELDSTGAAMAKVASTKGAIAYVSLDVVDDTVKAAKIDGVEATEKNILSGDYLLQRPFVMATMGKISEQDKQVQAFFDFVHSEEGKKVIKKVGLIVPKEK